MKSTLFQSKEAAEASRTWHIVDASGVPVGRLASEVATLIRGKHKASFTPHVDGGDFVIVINAAKVKLSGKKLEKKGYFRHTGYIGGIKEEKAARLMERAPDRIIRYAVEGMLPNGILGHRSVKKLKVYSGAEHPHAAQLPKVFVSKFAPR